MRQSNTPSRCWQMAYRRRGSAIYLDGWANGSDIVFRATPIGSPHTIGLPKRLMAARANCPAPLDGNTGMDRLTAMHRATFTRNARTASNLIVCPPFQYTRE